MYEISNYNSEVVQSRTSLESRYTRQESQVQTRSALRAVSEENKLAAVDRSEVSSASSRGQFAFSYSEQVRVSFAGSYSFSSGPPATFDSNFSFSFSISQSMAVEFGEGIEVSREAIQGEDFEFSSEGLLTLLENLIEELNAQEQQQVDLAGELDGKALSLLQQLGLIDEEGKATPALQLLSDYAGLNRFYAGEQVDAGAGTRYSAQLSSTQLNWQSWQQRIAAAVGNALGAGDDNSDTAAGSATVESGVGGANTVAGNVIDGDVTINDNDVININVTVSDKVDSHDK